MGTRLELHEILVDILGSNNVYFQPPSTLQMRYPAIIYSRRPIATTFADNSVYKQTTSYDITLIDKDPESDIVLKLSGLPQCRHDRHYKSNNLNHDVFTLYF